MLFHSEENVFSHAYLFTFGSDGVWRFPLFTSPTLNSPTTSWYMEMQNDSNSSLCYPMSLASVHHGIFWQEDGWP